MATVIFVPMFIEENTILNIWKLGFCPNQGEVLRKPKCFVRKFDETLDTKKSKISMKKKKFLIKSDYRYNHCPALRCTLPSTLPDIS